MDKHISERKHAKKRAIQRYDFRYNKQDRRNLIDIIQYKSKEHGIVIDAKCQTNRITKILLSYKGDQYYVVYDKKRKEIVTFLDTAWYTKD